MRLCLIILMFLLRTVDARNPAVAYARLEIFIYYPYPLARPTVPSLKKLDFQDLNPVSILSLAVAVDCETKTMIYYHDTLIIILFCHGYISCSHSYLQYLSSTSFPSSSSSSSLSSSPIKFRVVSRFQRWIFFRGKDAMITRALKPPPVAPWNADPRSSGGGGGGFAFFLKVGGWFYSRQRFSEVVWCLDSFLKRNLQVCCKLVVLCCKLVGCTMLL